MSPLLMMAAGLVVFGAALGYALCQHLNRRTPTPTDILAAMPPSIYTNPESTKHMKTLSDCAHTVASANGIAKGQPWTCIIDFNGSDETEISLKAPAIAQLTNQWKPTKSDRNLFN
jgi:hypothetical protein